MNLFIKPASVDDARFIAEVICSSWQSAYKNIIPTDVLARYTDIGARRALFERLISTGTDNFLLAFDGKKPCGICSYRSSRDADMDGWGEIVAIYTLEEYWGKGVGLALLNAGIEGLRGLGFCRVMLWTLADNARARKFYEKYGFRFDGTVKESAICGLAEVRYTLDANAANVSVAH